MGSKPQCFQLIHRKAVTKVIRVSRNEIRENENATQRRDLPRNSALHLLSPAFPRMAPPCQLARHIWAIPPKPAKQLTFQRLPPRGSSGVGEAG